MFDHFNTWYVYVPALALVTVGFAWAYCQAFEKDGFGRFGNGLLAAISAVVVCVLVHMESFLGVAQVERWLMGPTADDFEVAVGAIGTILAASCAYGVGLYLLGDYVAKWRRFRMKREARRVDYTRKARAQAAETATDRPAAQTATPTTKHQPRVTYTLHMRDIVQAMRKEGWEIHPETK